MLRFWTRSHRVRFLALLLAIVLVAAACGGGDESVVTFGAQTYAEPKILMHAGAILLEEHTSCKTKVIEDLGGIAVIEEAINHGDVDVATAWLGGAGGILHPAWRDEIDMTDPQWRDADHTLEFVQRMYRERLDRTFMDPLGFENTYALIMARGRAEELGITKVSDLREHSANMVIGMDDSYMERPVDGYEVLLDYYELPRFADAISMNINLLYQAVRDGEVDVAVGYSSDPRIYAFDLVWIEDDKSFFPPYHAAYSITDRAAEKCPEIYDVIGQLSGRIDIETMRRLSAEVDLNQRSPVDVAREFLREEGLID